MHRSGSPGDRSPPGRQQDAPRDRTALPLRGLRSGSPRWAAAALLLLVSSTGWAARFGVPPAGGGQPAGWFVLVGDDAFDPAASDAFGDVAHSLTVYIEVARRGLTVNVYDPGLFDGRLGPDELDVTIDDDATVDVGAVRYILFGPDDSVLADDTYGADTAATNRALVQLYSAANAPPGVYRFEARMVDTLLVTEDVNVFGLDVPGHACWTYNVTGGQVNEGGATIAPPLSVFPSMSLATAGTDGAGPVCGTSFITYDLDAVAGGMEPSQAVETSQGYVFPASQFPSSLDAQWHQTDNAGLPRGLLASDDHGLWRWDFSLLTQPEDLVGNLVPARDLNAFSLQLLNYGAPPRDYDTWPALPPFTTDAPRRVYLPADDGTAPPKEHLGHAARVVGGFPVISLGETSTLEVTLSLTNPTTHDLTDVRGTTTVTPDAWVTDPVLTGSTGGLLPTVTGRRIDFAGSVAAGATGTVTYRVDVAPTALGRFFLTGDGTDFVSPTAPVMASYLTPYVPSFPGFSLLREVQGPICQLEYEAVMPTCAVDAVLVAERLTACPGTPIRLDGSASSVLFNCPGGFRAYQWSVNGALLHPFPAPDVITVTPLFDDTYTLEVACSTDLACIDSDEITFALLPGLQVDLGPDRGACSGDRNDLTPAIVDETGGTPSGFLWSTDPPGEPGDGDTTPTLSVAPTRTTTYTFRAENDLSCEGSDSVVIDVRVPVVAILPDPAALCPGATLDLVATPGFVDYAWETVPPGLPGDGEADADVTATAVGATYRVVVRDAAGCTGQAEVTTTGASDVVPRSLGPTLRLAKAGTSDLRLTWAAAADPTGDHQVVSLDCDSDLDGRCDVEPLASLFDSAVTWDSEPATSLAHVELNGLTRPSWLVFYKVRGSSPCTLTPGPFDP